MTKKKDDLTADFSPKIETETLRGDVRDAILTEFKTIPKPWQAMNEDEQERIINRADDIANTLVRRAIDLIAARGLPSIPIEVGKMTMDGAEVEGKFKCYADDEMLLRARHLQNSRAMFVLASPDAFNGEEKKPEPDVVGDLAMPKGPTDAEAIAHFGRKNGSGEAHA
ncbi:MAG: hypothetical protein ABIO35_08160 [Nitrobacter sp.]